MSAFRESFAERWRAAVTCLQLGTERIQATADALPLDVVLANDRDLRPDPMNLLGRHMEALSDYMTALACVQALLREYDVGKA